MERRTEVPAVVPIFKDVDEAALRQQVFGAAQSIAVQCAGMTVDPNLKIAVFKADIL